MCLCYLGELESSLNHSDWFPGPRGTALRVAALAPVFLAPHSHPQAVAFKVSLSDRLFFSFMMMFK